MTKFLINFKYAFRIHKPVLIMRLIWTWILIAIFNKRPLRYVDTAIGYKCNLSCDHCFAREKNNPRRGRMPPSFFKGVVKQCMDLGAVNFSFQGGEPLVYDDLELYVKAARPFMNLISVTTNGTLLTPEKCRELRSWGVDIITLSIDVHRPLLKNWHSIIKSAKKAGMNVTIGTVITHQEIEMFQRNENLGLANLMAYALRHKTLLMLTYGVPMGGFSGKDVMLTDEDVKVVKTICQKYPYIRTDFQANWKDEGCGASKEILFINPYGDVFPCPFIDIPFGNVRSLSIAEIRRRMLCQKQLQKYHQKCLAGQKPGLCAEF